MHTIVSGKNCSVEAGREIGGSKVDAGDQVGAVGGACAMVLKKLAAISAFAEARLGGAE